MINTFVLSGEIKRVEVNPKPTKKGSAAMITLQYGPHRQETDQNVQFMNMAVIRVPPYVYEKCRDALQPGRLADVTGHMQGVLKRMMADGFVFNELVADRLQIVDDGPTADPSVEAAEASAS